MAWQNVIVGYKVESFCKNDIIPVGAIFLRSIEVVSAWSASGKVWYRTEYEYQVPIYKKKNIKTKKP